MCTLRFSRHSEQMHKHLRGIPDMEQVIIINSRESANITRRSRISLAVGEYHYALAKISLAISYDNPYNNVVAV